MKWRKEYYQMKFHVIIIDIYRRCENPTNLIFLIKKKSVIKNWERNK